MAITIYGSGFDPDRHEYMRSTYTIEIQVDDQLCSVHIPYEALDFAIREEMKKLMDWAMEPEVEHDDPDLAEAARRIHNFYAIPEDHISWHDLFTYDDEE